jgi:NADH-quinone oxidoreductase subunit I
MGRCIVCGYCEEACPVDAIGMSKQYELVSGNLEDLIFRKQLLLSDYDKLKVQPIWEAKPDLPNPKGAPVV